MRRKVSNVNSSLVGSLPVAPEHVFGLVEFLDGKMFESSNTLGCIHGLQHSRGPSQGLCDTIRIIRWPRNWPDFLPGEFQPSSDELPQTRSDLAKAVEGRTQSLLGSSKWLGHFWPGVIIVSRAELKHHSSDRRLLGSFRKEGGKETTRRLLRHTSYIL